MTYGRDGSRNGKRFLRITSGWPLLLFGGVVLAVSNGRWILPLAAWLAPVLLLRYVRTSRTLWRGLVALWLVLFVSAPIAWLGLWPFPPLVMARIVAIGALLTLVPYALDRLSRDRIRGMVQTLVFPASAVAIEFVGYLRSDTTWGNVAYTQTGNLPLLQFASIAGMWGITFLMLWLAPVANNVWQDGWTRGRARGGAVTFATVLGFVLLFGATRLLLFAPSGEELRVATVTQPELVDITTPEGRQFQQEFQQIFMKQQVDDATAARIRRRADAGQEPLFAATRRMAEAGADLVVWPEGGLISFDEEQDRALIARGRQLGAAEEIYIGFTIALTPRDLGSLNENRLLLIDPSGAVLQTYWKHLTVPMVEEPWAVPGSKTVAAAATPFGRLGGVICYDLDSPRYLRDAGRQRIDVLLAPSGDWPAIKDVHARMAVMRAVEQGFSLVRPANHGLSLAADHQGRILATMDHYATSDREMAASVPAQGSRTIYTRIGDLLPWTCLALCVLFAASIAWQIVASRAARELRDEGTA